MSKDEKKKQRLAVLARMDALEARAKAGEDVSEEQRALGKELDAAGKKKPRRNVVDADQKAPAPVPVKKKGKQGREKIDIAPKMGRYEEMKAAGLTDRQIAKEFGLSVHVIRRIREKSTLAEEKKNYDYWKDTALRNGIKRTTFATRLHNGWSFKDAATTKIHVFPADPWCVKAVENGISKSAYKSRLKIGWTKREASTIPQGVRRETYYAMEAMK